MSVFAASIAHSEMGASPCSVVKGRITNALLTSTFGVYSAPYAHEDTDTPLDQDFAENHLARGETPYCQGFIRLSCPSCAVCVPIRVLLDAFNERSEHRRAVERNEDLIVQVHRGIPALDRQGDDEFSRLLLDYHSRRFPGGRLDTVVSDAWEASYRLSHYADYPGMNAMHLTMRDEKGVLRGVNIFHVAKHSGYDTTFFYDYSRFHDGLGQALTMHVMRWLKAHGFHFNYLGHWTRLPTAFSWKDKFTPLELYMGGRWERHDGKPGIRRLRMGAQPYPIR